VAQLLKCPLCRQEVINVDEFLKSEPLIFDPETETIQDARERNLDKLNNATCPDCGVECTTFWDGEDIPGGPVCPVCLAYDIESIKDTPFWKCNVCSHEFHDDVFDSLPGQFKGTFNMLMKKLEEAGIGASDICVASIQIKDEGDDEDDVESKDDT